MNATAESRPPTDEFQQFVDDVVAPSAPSFEAQGTIPDEIVSEMARRGYLAATIAEEYGGSSMDMTAYGELHARIGTVSSSLRSLITVHDMVAETIMRFGSDEQKSTWLPRLAAGDAIAAFSLSEPGAGSDAASITTAAVATNGGYRLSGHKSWISFGQLADVFLVAAKVDGTGPVVGFLVPSDASGVAISPIEGMLGLRAAMLAELRLEDCFVPLAARIGPEKAPPGLLVGNALHHGRYSVAWGCVGIGEACRDAALSYSKDRFQFGVPLSEHQLIRRLLTNMITEVSAARLLCEQAGRLWARRDRDAIQATLVAKYFSSAMAHRVASDAVQVHGARGLSAEFALERHFHDARVMEVIEGSNEIQQLLIASYGLRGNTGVGGGPDGRGAD